MKINPVQSILNRKTGTEPVLIITLQFGDTLLTYTDRKLDSKIDGIQVDRVYTNISDLQNQKRASNIGSCGSVSVTFDDTDQSLYFAHLNYQMDQRKAAIYLYYPKTGPNALMPLLVGQVSEPIQWSEGERTFTCTIEQHIQSNEIGYAPTEVDIPNLDPDVYGTPWPMIFGKAAHVPCVRIKTHSTGFLKTDIKILSNIYNEAKNPDKTLTYTTSCDVYSYLSNGTSEKNNIYIDQGSMFPQGQKCKISIEKVIFEGQFNGEQFKVSQANVPYYNKLLVDKRNEDTTDPTANFANIEYNVLWLKDKTINLVGFHCYMNWVANGKNYEIHNVCIKQVGTKCYFAKGFTNPANGQYVAPNEKNTIASAYWIPRAGLHKNIYVGDIQEPFNVMVAWSQIKKKNPNAIAAVSEWIKSHLEDLDTGFWHQQSNAEVRLFNTDPDIYAASIIPISDVLAVYGKQTVKFGEDQEREIFAPIPKNWYTINKDDTDYKYNGKGTCTVTLIKPLADHSTEGQKWSNDIYVTAQSEIGPNTYDIIQYILNNFTNIPLKSNTQVRGFVDDTPSNFAIFDVTDAVQLVHRIAWQARMAFRTDAGYGELIYLPKKPTVNFAFSNSNVELRSLNLTLTSTSEIKTKLVGIWSDTYKDDAVPSRLSVGKTEQFKRVLKRLRVQSTKKGISSRAYAFRLNSDRYGEITEEVAIFIYNEEQYVKKTIDFWGGRMANSWRKAQFSTFMPAIGLQVFDGVSLSMFNLAGIEGVVDSISYDHNSKTVKLDVWISLTSGGIVESSYAWPEA